MLFFRQFIRRSLLLNEVRRASAQFSWFGLYKMYDLKLFQTLQFLYRKLNVSLRLNRQITTRSNKSFFGLVMLTANVVRCVSNPEPHIEESSSLYNRSRIEESCFHSISEILNLIEEISVAVTNCAIQYKNCLNELISSLEAFKSVEEYSSLREKFENAIIVARANVSDSRKEFLDLITLIEGVYKVSSAVSELSFLIGSESSALRLFDAVNSLRMKINDEMENVKKLENEYLLIERNVITDTKV